MHAWLSRRQFGRRAFVQRVGWLGASAAGVVALSGCGAMPGLASRKPPLIGFLSNLEASDLAEQIQGVRDGLRQHGLIEGQNLRIEWRFANGDNDLLPGLTAELLGLGVQVIVATGGTAPRYARQGTDRVPIVAIGGDMVGAGLAASHGRPGGNVTGVSFRKSSRVKPSRPSLRWCRAPERSRTWPTCQSDRLRLLY